MRGLAGREEASPKQEDPHREAHPSTYALLEDEGTTAEAVPAGRPGRLAARAVEPSGSEG